jgi:hypothetical protein
MKFHRSALPGLLFAIAALLVPATALADQAGPPSGDGVQPVLVPGNPNCAALNADDENFPTITSDFGFKVDQSPNGAFPLDESEGGELTGGAPSDAINSVTISESDGQFFDWAATLGIDAVIVKAGDNADAYVYDPEDFADTELHAPFKDDGSPREISHIEFCYDYELTVSKNAETEFKRDYDWQIEKSNDGRQPQKTLAPGETYEVAYEVTVGLAEPPYEDFGWTVYGEITVENATPFVANEVAVTDEIAGYGEADELDCNGEEPEDGLPATIAAGGSLTCAYSAELPSGESTVNKAKATTTTPEVGEGEGEAPVVFSGVPSESIDECVVVYDDKAEEGGEVELGEVCFDDEELPKTFVYAKTFGPFENECKTYEFTNTASLTEARGEPLTKQAMSTVAIYVECELEVEKTAETEFKRKYFWEIEKLNDADEPAMVMPGQPYTVNYEVIADLLGEPEDFAWSVHGTISVENPAEFAVQVDVTDEISGVGAVVVDCNGEEPEDGLPATIAAEGKLTCDYWEALEDAASRTNTAIAISETEGVAGGEAEAAVEFGETEPEPIDECVTVTDDNLEPEELGEVCVGETPASFEYAKEFQFDEEDCGETFEFPNTAKFETNDTEDSGEAGSTVVIEVKCAGEGCTLTQGYWKTHSEFGPAPYDDTWDAYEGGAAEFLSSGESWHGVFWLPPKGGNAYLILAHQYMAAVLNQLNEASVPPEVAQALEQAEALLLKFSIEEPPKGSWRHKALKLAGLLAEYNEGGIGPGHCSEDGYSTNQP